MRSYLKFADFVLGVAKFLTIVIMAGMTVSVLIGVFFRFVIVVPIAWPPEVARFLMVALTMIASSVAIRQVEHVGITFVVNALPSSVRTSFYVLGIVLTGTFLILLTYYSARLTFEMGPRQRTTSLGVSMVVAFIAMPVGGLMMLVQLVAAWSEGLQRARVGQSPFGGDPGNSPV